MSQTLEVSSVTISAIAAIRIGAVQKLRCAIDAVPQSGSVRVCLRDDSAAVDATISLLAVGHSPAQIATLVSRSRFRETDACLLAISALSHSMSEILRMQS